ncbi:serine/threonine-protein kinase [Amycolatopsis albispora]|uniref:non-specific serine/threonine protein kinase n=1 Tax=Amycolatopsis albispora TaxID=1804986 RepID=A0A344L0G8_9PSEU|nr:serine/threonine-protein kinase [Amycolatopsis albispora]AXB41542.1 serine/threonine protein kinase [Amycolatopsis albispora]
MKLLEDGQRVGDAYEVERFLGEGAFAEVYRVRHDIFGRQAMKVFKRTGTAEETKTMLGEAIMLTRIGHPNIIRVFHAGMVSSPHGMSGYFTMEYVAGGNLQRFWVSHRERFVPVEDSVRILHQVADGLAVAHSARPAIVHRDITPQNILVGYDTDGLRAKLSDFGLAKSVNPMTLMASTKGTLAFKAPESLLNRQGDSRAGDVWALGTIAYLLLTDTLPYEDGGPTSYFGTQRRTPPPPPHEFNSEVDGELDRIVLRALDPDPSARTPDATALAAELAEWRACRGRGKAKRVVDLPSRTSKNVLGHPSSATEEEAARLAGRARELARQATTLHEAADLMEEAFNKSPKLRATHEHWLRLWRKGVLT